MIINDCGQYVMKGTILKNQKEVGYRFVLNQGTKSEYNFKIKIEDELKIAPYIDKAVGVTANIESVKDQKGIFSSIEKAEFAFVDKLNPAENITLIKKMDCKK